LGILGIENQKPNIFFLSFPAANNQIFFINFYFLFFLRICTDTTTHPRRASEGVQREGEGKEMTSSARTGLCLRRLQRVRTNASLFTPCNFITDATVHPSHGRPSGHRPSVRPSVIVCVTTLVTTLFLQNCPGASLFYQDVMHLP
jgi:hypothetical protein